MTQKEAIKALVGRYDIPKKVGVWLIENTSPEEWTRVIDGDIDWSYTKGVKDYCDQTCEEYNKDTRWTYKRMLTNADGKTAKAFGQGFVTFG